MLTGLNINNFAIIKQLNIDLDSGMTVITGETGAGKSIAIDALSLCMGYRSDVGMIRNGCNQAQVSATFSIDKNSIAYAWLEEKSLLDEEQPTEVIVRRLINTSGPSKAYINEHPVSISFLKELTQYLVHLHGQHAPQLLLKTSYQLVLVDRYINQKELLQQVETSYQKLTKLQKEYEDFLHQKENFQTTRLLLEYKYRELKELNLVNNEYEELEKEYMILSNQAHIKELNQQIIDVLSDGNYNVNSLLSRAANNAHRLSEYDKSYHNLATMLDEALINIQESVAEAQNLSSFEFSQEDMERVRERMHAYDTMAKKNNILPEQLYSYYVDISKQLKSLQSSIGDQSEFEEKLEKAQLDYQEKARTLSDARRQGAANLSAKVEEIMKDLNMKDAQFYIDVIYDPKQISETGSDQVRFMLNSNLGQQAQELHKVASGGELSRIALAIQLLTASHLDNGTLIFDEVDVGISGKTATVVGRIIRQLSKRIQVISVTHLAQVAAYASNHFQVEKWNEGLEANTKMTLLDRTGRVMALASLIGHEDLSPEAIKNAEFLLDQSQKDPQLDYDLIEN
ncbi:DNA repair protein RecN [Psittacicella melopsittaci]|uniref:DNA repair protein RecN n=1 Tax=Psittacicella melopsittaci TaxID=2028576 RepID=A0A3A1Y599_9GAMM|nr:DNA repair protein RecN [Psittacicella melopsittaci]RIY32446.1 DNA repair protein RecN [Psittacicella melopsittaci]